MIVKEVAATLDFDWMLPNLPVERGVFNLFVDAGKKYDQPARHLLYRLWCKDAVGHPLDLTGFKDITHPAAALSRFDDVWSETSTPYTAILAGQVEVGDDGDAPLIGAGNTHILPLDFAHQVTTFRVVSGPGLVGRRASAAVGDLFMGQLWEVFQPRLPWRTHHLHSKDEEYAHA